jgi:hypothetical protein
MGASFSDTPISAGICELVFKLVLKVYKNIKEIK